MGWAGRAGRRVPQAKLPERKGDTDTHVMPEGAMGTEGRSQEPVQVSRERRVGG